MRMLPFLVAVSAAAVPASVASSAGDCHIGAYRLADGGVVDIGPTDSADLRWRRFGDFIKDGMVKGAYGQAAISRPAER